MMKKIEDDDDKNKNKVIIHWSELCRDMLDLIASHLATPWDYMSFRGVCKSWRSLTPPLSRLPWLLLYDDPPTTRLRHFYSPLEDRVHSFDIPEMSGRRFCCGYSKGWLVMFQEGTKKLSLLNPFSGGSIPLPLLPKLCPEDISVGVHRKWRRSPRYIQKVILSKAPTSPDCIIVIIFFCGYLGFCRPGDKTWICLDMDYDGPFEDAVFFKDRLVAVSELGYITEFDIGEEDEDSTTWDDVQSVRRPKDEQISEEQRFILTSPDGSQEEEQEMDNVKFYIVESCGGDLLLAVQLKHDNLSQGGEGIKNTTAEFLLFRLDNNTDHGRQWVRLEGLGDEALFLGKNESRSIIVADDDSLHGLRKNCIYFTESEHGCFTGNTVDPHWDLDMGVYSLENRSVSDYIISKKPYRIGGGKQVWESPPIWLN
ncbi:putative F-box protein [Acorus gramineus]|uniref:F-box protein n=1 Tax=Acorus gramineus TaxID=55184 RepID=A0AAV9BBE4_ACOGR|nr:putative F-box protein [Acorus gramineus]